jgi:hypothetical protein
VTLQDVDWHAMWRLIIGYSKKFYPSTHIKLRSETLPATSIVGSAVTFSANQVVVVNVASLIYSLIILLSVGRVAQSVLLLAMGWTFRGSKPGGGEIFCTCPDRAWGPPSLLYNGYRVFPGGRKRPVRDADPSPPSSAEV